MANRFIERLRQLADLSAGAVAMLEGVTASPLHYGPRQDLIREGDRSGHLLVILDGWAYRHRLLPSGIRQITAFLMPGDTCDFHFNTPVEADYGVQSATAVTAASIKGEVVRSLFRDFPDALYAIYAAQLADEATARAWITSLGRRTSITRAAQLLLELFIRATRLKLGNGPALAFPLSQVVLADALGMTAVHVNRVLQELRRGGAVELRRGNLLITDVQLLAHIAGFDDSYLSRRLR